MISVIGGTYKEINLDSNSIENYGSGLRCCHFLLENDAPVKFYTAGNLEVEKYLEVYKNIYHSFTYELFKSDFFLTFKYCFALDNPDIYPNVLNLNKTDGIKIIGEDIVCFGMLESNYTVIGNRIVYDPQTSINPSRFSNFGKAEQLIYIVNSNEAKSISGCIDIENIVKYFFLKEKVYALIIKNGPYGATLYIKDKKHNTPAYITENVKKIGSGDIFTSSFSFYWLIANLSLEDSFMNASKATALYCDQSIIKIPTKLTIGYSEYNAKDLCQKQIYLASPIFSLSEILLIDKIRSAFHEFGVKVFSPFHDIGLGDDENIAKLDLEALENSDIVFGVLDGLDSGTLIELGYAMGKNKKLVGYHRSCKQESLFMLKPANMKIFNNLTTAIYHTIWNL